MLERVGGKVLGYDTEQVDALMDRVRRQYENPRSRFVIPSMLSSAGFDLVPGGYRIDQVDQALAQVAEDFEKADLQRRLERLGKRAIQRELESMLETVARVIATEPDKRFSPARSGFNKKLVRQLIADVRVENGKISAPDSMDLRTRPLGRSSGGPARAEVNELISVIIGAVHRQQLLDQLP